MSSTVCTYCYGHIDLNIYDVCAFNISLAYNILNMKEAHTVQVYLYETLKWQIYSEKK
jgi:tRNA C32,U32 (ribose-2'-O)-methylase TrmJ